MKMLLQTNNQQTRSKKRTRPVDHFKKCPKCGDSELIKMGPDVLCSSCDWDSLVWDVSRGGMDDLNAASMEYFAPTPKLVKSRPAKEEQIIVAEEKINPSLRKQLGA